jgi:hypothetical protein
MTEETKLKPSKPRRLRVALVLAGVAAAVGVGGGRLGLGSIQAVYDVVA